MTVLASAPNSPLPQTPQQQTPWERHARALLWLAAALLLLFSIHHLARVFFTGVSLGQSSGIVIGQAIDLADGMFYRPIVSDRGFGGTRYMPLPSALIAPFIRLGLDPVNTALAITLLTDIALLAGVYVLLRRLGAPAGLAWPAAVLVLAAGCAQYAATTVRGDLLPAALNVWGLAFALTADQHSPRPRPLLAALFFTLAFTAKVVALYGLVACLLAMLLAGQWKTALKLAAFTLTGILLCLGLIQLASDGRFLDNMRACATGGANFDDIRRSYLRRLGRNGFGLDWTATAFCALAALAALRMRLPDLRHTPVWAFGITAVVTLGLFTSPGVAYNVLLDLHIIAVVFLVLQIARRRVPPAATITLLALITLASMPYLRLKHIDKGVSRAAAQGVLTAIGPGPQPFLGKPPMLHVYAREAPYVLDPWMFRHLPQHKQFVATLHEQLRSRHFRAIVVGNLAKEKAEEGAANQFGPGFTNLLRDNYTETARVMNGKKTAAVIYKPKSPGSPPEVQIVQTRKPRVRRSLIEILLRRALPWD